MGTLGQLWRRARTPGDHGIIPCSILVVAAAATVIQIAGVINTTWTTALIYDRAGIAAGQWWRLWTGHLVHYGWLHFAIDTGILLCLGRVITWPSPSARVLALLVVPPIISLALYTFDAGMIHYAGLSALNFGLFVFYAIMSWRRDRTDWLWPAVLIACLGELAFEALRGGSGGGLIAFSDPSVHIATAAHVAGGLCGIVLWLCLRRRRPPNPASGRRPVTGNAPLLQETPGESPCSRPSGRDLRDWT